MSAWSGIRGVACASTSLGWKIECSRPDSIIRAKPMHRDAYIHARFHPETFREFFDQQSMFVFFVTVYIGAGLIANPGCFPTAALLLLAAAPA